MKLTTNERSPCRLAVALVVVTACFAFLAGLELHVPAFSNTSNKLRDLTGLDLPKRSVVYEETKLTLITTTTRSQGQRVLAPKETKAPKSTKDTKAPKSTKTPTTKAPKATKVSKSTKGSSTPMPVTPAPTYLCRLC